MVTCGFGKGEIGFSFAGDKNILNSGISLVVQWLRLCAPNAGGPGSIPGQGTRSHVLQLKIPHSATKTWSSQINILKRKKKILNSGFGNVCIL